MPTDTQRLHISLLLASALALSACATAPSGPVDGPDEVDGEEVVSEPVAPTGELSGDGPTPVDFPEGAVAIPVTPDVVFEALDLPDEHAGHVDVFGRLREGMSLYQPESERRIDVWVDWYSDHQDYLDRVFGRAGPYLYHIAEEIEARGMPMEIALLPVVESAFDPFAYSHGRAAGLWQIIPGTGRRFGLEQNWWYDGRRDPIESTRAALDYLEYLHGYFDGDWMHALAAYNTGEGNVARSIRRSEHRGRPTDFWNLRLPAETRSYVPKLLAISRIVADPDAHGVVLPEIANDPYMERVTVDSQIDLSLVAELAGIDLKQLYILNAGYNRWATDPDGPHHIALPVDRAERFRQSVAEIPPSDRVAWVRHTIRPGETLGAIADRYRTTVDTLVRSNGIRGHIIRAGDSLMVPSPRASNSAYALAADQRLEALQNADRDGHRLVHVVASGDTFWDLSRDYRVGVRELAGWNGMAPADPLRIGQELVVWTKDPGVISASGMDVAPPIEDRIRTITYSVRRGDSLSRIASRFNVSVNDLTRWNGLNPQRYLQPGQRLKLEIDVTQQSSP